VLVTSDHGFIQLPPDAGIEFRFAEAHQGKVKLEETVNYRYLADFPLPKGKSIGPYVTLNWQQPGPKGQTTSVFTLPVGSVWYQREGGRPARYSHGGVSMAELVVPGVMLQRITQKQARIELFDVPGEMEVSEDEPARIELVIRNTGNVDAEYELTGTTNLDETVLSERGGLAVGKSRTIGIDFTPRYATDANRDMVAAKTTRTITLRLAHTDTAGRRIEPPDGRASIGVHVKPKALKLYSDDMFQGLP
jgi:hypothetical protein